jgi:beta-barrel assembly-enhancing protease
MKKQLLSLSVAFCCSACSNPGLQQLSSQVLSSTGYVSQSQADSLVSASSNLVKSQEDLLPEQEYYLGRAVSATVLAQYPPRRSESATSYLNKIGMTVASVSDTPETFGGYHFMIVESPQINAFSAPGGFVYVSSGFIKELPDEDAVAAVLAHEIAHIVKRHGVNAISNAKLFSSLTEFSQAGASIAASQVSSPVDLTQITGIFAESVSGVVDKLLTKGFDRRQEYEADLYAAELLQRAGYDPNALVRVLGILESHARGEEGGWYATHPAAGDRIAELDSDFTFPPPAQVPAARQGRFSTLRR